MRTSGFTPVASGTFPATSKAVSTLRVPPRREAVGGEHLPGILPAFDPDSLVGHQVGLGKRGSPHRCVGGQPSVYPTIRTDGSLELHRAPHSHALVQHDAGRILT